MPKTPPSRCTSKGCGRFATYRSRCDEHQPTGWYEYRRTKGTNTTAERLGIRQSTWDRLRQDTMSRHGGVCYWCGRYGADHVDHIQAVGLGGSKTDPDNLALIHSEPCHREKTAQELTEMRKRKAGRGNPFFFPTRKNQKPQKPVCGVEKENPNPGIRSI